MNRVFIISFLLFFSITAKVNSQENAVVLTATDKELLDLVCADHFITWTSKMTGKQIYIANRTDKGNYFSEKEIKSGFEWDKREPPSHELIESLLSRNVSRVSLSNFTPTNPNVIVGDKDLKDEDYSNWEFTKNKDIISFYLPGYSKDGKEAMVCFYYSMSPHVVLATYIVEHDGKSWNIKGKARYWNP